ncbi:MAG: hypothetical protein NC240_04350 [Clostridium sp.]|nr:hypothetical protein [Clostridium sp.]
MIELSEIYKLDEDAESAVNILTNIRYEFDELRGINKTISDMLSDDAWKGLAKEKANLTHRVIEAYAENIFQLIFEAEEEMKNLMYNAYDFSDISEKIKLIKGI